ncbi:replication initiation factor domain-containing protein [Bacillus mobilis]|uniref:replication initiation factor domain-containing protein n=1 Tax=Bacillus mobilis TaxID=2026190 RepID=UPI0021CDD6CC|nr:replication initiation factor domain-containing protein [Bacillus mobilis]MCU5437051.1 replication initiation factor domain-containing protein [Bacillus mobilis]
MGNQDSPRTCNTGAQRTSLHAASQRPTRAEDILPVVRNEQKMRALIDWVQITFRDIMPADLIDHMGLKPEEFHHQNMGKFGYRQCVKYGHMTIYFDGLEEMGIHLVVTGQGCREYEAQGLLEWHELFDVFADLGGTFTRLDIAIDDFEGHFTIKSVLRKIKAGELISKFKSAERREGIDIGTGATIGETIYYGSPRSRIFVRMYDKLAQQKSKGIDVGDITAWVRTEIESKDERAQAIAEIVRRNAHGGETVGQTVAGILKYYMRFTVKGKDSNKRRWKTAPFWDKFLGEIEPLRLAKELPERTIKRMEDWLGKQVAPSLAVLMRAYDGDISKITDLIDNGDTRLTVKEMDMIARFKEGLENEKSPIGED